MKQRLVSILTVFGLVVGGLWVTQASALQVITREDISQKVVPTSCIVKTADNAILLIDTSEVMGKPYGDSGMTRLQVVKEGLLRRNELLPHIGINLGIYTYPPWNPIYPVQPFDKAKVEKALADLPAAAEGRAYLTRALEKVEPVLAGLKGKTVVFLLTDGRYPLERHMKKPVVRARELAKKYHVCFYFISTAETDRARRNLEELASVNECSRVIPFEVWQERPEYTAGALYVVKSGEKVVTVTKQTIVGVRTDDIHFEFNSEKIVPPYDEELDAIGKFVQEHPGTYVLIHGYADNQGDPEYNLRLARRRAEAVANYLKKHFNIAENRMAVMWYGDLNPVAPNDTEEGRARNRRVEIGIGGLQKETLPQ